MKITVFLICLLASALSGCNSSKDAMSLSGPKWVLQQLGDKAVGKLQSGNEIFIRFDDAEKRVNGLAGCNRFFGGYETDGKKLKFSPMGATRMACPDLELEGSFFQMLENTDSYRIKNQELSLLGKGKVLATFKSSTVQEEK